MFEQAFKNIDDILSKEAGCTTELNYTEQTSWLLFLKYLAGLFGQFIRGIFHGSRRTFRESVPGGGWHNRGYLPHFDGAETVQHVTFHLADSLPKEVVDRLDEETGSLPEEKQDVARRKRVDAWIDVGHGSCLLQNPGIADMVQTTLLYFDTQRYRLLAWVVMPNHVHVLFQPLIGWSVAKIVASWKKFTARKIGDSLKKATDVPGEVSRVWHREY